jgi:hypothetical protein
MQELLCVDDAEGQMITSDGRKVSIRNFKTVATKKAKDDAEEAQRAADKRHAAELAEAKKKTEEAKKELSAMLKLNAKKTPAKQQSAAAPPKTVVACRPTLPSTVAKACQSAAKAGDSQKPPVSFAQPFDFDELVARLQQHQAPAKRPREGGTAKEDGEDRGEDIEALRKRNREERERDIEEKRAQLQRENRVADHQMEMNRAAEKIERARKDAELIAAKKRRDESIEESERERTFSYQLEKQRQIDAEGRQEAQHRRTTGFFELKTGQAAYIHVALQDPLTARALVSSSSTSSAVSAREQELMAENAALATKLEKQRQQMLGIYTKLGMDQEEEQEVLEK